MPLLQDGDDPTANDSSSTASPPTTPGPGKDSARLLEDILEHEFADPQLRNVPPTFDPLKPHKSPDPSHVHSWIMKPRSCLQRRAWSMHFGDSAVVALCEKCRVRMTVTAVVTAEGQPKCGAPEAEKKYHHFHLEKWTNNTRYSPNSNSVESKP